MMFVLCLPLLFSVRSACYHFSAFKSLYSNNNTTNGLPNSLAKPLKGCGFKENEAKLSGFPKRVGAFENTAAN